MLGILRDGNGKAIQILNNLAVDLEHLRRKSRNPKPAIPEIESRKEKTYI
jgi:ATP-dependent Clp protease ATP-binding subunit ClpC